MPHDETIEELRAPSVIVPLPGAAGQFQAAAVLLRRAAVICETLSRRPESEDARKANRILVEACGIFSDACFDLSLLNPES